MTIGELRAHAAALIHAQCSQREVATLSGISYNTVGRVARYPSPRGNVKLETLAVVLAALEVRPAVNIEHIHRRITNWMETAIRPAPATFSARVGGKEWPLRYSSDFSRFRRDMSIQLIKGRAATGMTQREVATRAGVSHRSVTALENHGRETSSMSDVSMCSVVAVLRAVGVEVDFVAGWFCGGLGYSEK